MKPANVKNRTHGLYLNNPERSMAAWYKWEFLRRNSEYRADYQGFMDSSGAWFKRRGYWYDLKRRARWTESDQGHFRTKIEPRIICLCQKWQIFDLFPPGKGLAYAYEITKFGERGLVPPTGIAPASMRDFRFAGRSSDLALIGKSVSAKRNGSCLSVEFNLNWRMKDLMEYAKRAIRLAQRGYRDELHERGLQPPKGRRRFKDYKMHLRVWDLSRKGKTVPEISKMLSEQDLKDYSLQTVRDHLDAARRLISGHFKEIT